jgi:hypothetical protein
MVTAMEVVDTVTAMHVIITVMFIGTSVIGTGVALIGMLPSAVVGGAVVGTATARVHVGDGAGAATSGSAANQKVPGWRRALWRAPFFCV